MAKKKKADAPGLNPASIVVNPQCPKCGWCAEASCVSGAGCPKCGTRIYAASDPPEPEK